MNKHTSAPWKYDNTRKYYRNKIIRRNGQLICKMIKSITITEEEFIANIHLIVAAPLLLEACQKLVAWDDSNGDVKLFSEACSQARHATTEAIK